MDNLEQDGKVLFTSEEGRVIMKSTTNPQEHQIEKIDLDVSAKPEEKSEDKTEEKAEEILELPENENNDKNEDIDDI